MRMLVYKLIILLLLPPFVFLNLGKWMDVTERPVKSDIIICLGGGTIDRVKKSIELLEKGYSRQNIFILLGESWYNQPYIKKKYPKLQVVIDERPKSTAEEMRFIKQYMKKNGYKSALIVTDPPHTRRASLFLSLVSIGSDNDMTFKMVGSGVSWWDAEHYWDNKRSRGTVIREIIKIPYGIWKLVDR